MRKLNVVVCGGTFDHFHKGHKSFLRFILSLSNKIILGLTTEEYIRNKKLSNSIESYSERKNSIEEFFEKENVLDRLEIEPIDDLFIPKKWEELKIDAIVVSNDTQKGAEIINQRRRKLGLKDLKIIVAPLVHAKDGKLISSERIRNGEIDREGKLYIKPEWLKKDLVLPENLRKELKKPFGVLSFNVLKDHSEFSLVATVGDVTTKRFNELSLNQNISVIDFRVKRKERFRSIRELGFLGNEKIVKANNPPGYITKDLFRKITEIFKANPIEKIILEVEGEEDLAVLPIVLTAPLGTTVFYGQPNEGMVRVEVSEESKRIVYGLVEQFEMLKWIRQAHHPEPAEG